MNTTNEDGQSRAQPHFGYQYLLFPLLFFGLSRMTDMELASEAELAIIACNKAIGEMHFVKYSSGNNQKNHHFDTYVFPTHFFWHGWPTFIFNSSRIFFPRPIPNLIVNFLIHLEPYFFISLPRSVYQPYLLHYAPLGIIQIQNKRQSIYFSR